MRLTILSLLAASIALFGGCSVCDRLTGINPELNIVHFHGEIYRCSEVECSVAGSEGGPPICRLEIAFETDSETRFAFSVEDPENCKDSLLTKGSHMATGGHGDVIRTFLPGSVS